MLSTVDGGVIEEENCVFLFMLVRIEYVVILGLNGMCRLYYLALEILIYCNVYLLEFFNSNPEIKKKN